MKVLNFGSLNIDYVYKVKEFVKAGETISSFDYNINAGGKGLNQSVALKRAGFEVSHAGKIGKEGAFLLKLLKSEEINTENIIISNQENGHAIIQVNKSGNNCILLHGGANMAISHDDIDNILYRFKIGDLVVLQNEISGIDYIIDKCFEKGMKIAINIAPINGLEEKYNLSKVDVIFVNEIEGKAISKKSNNFDILKWFEKNYPNACFVLTLGGSGSMCHYKNKVYKQDIIEVDVKDTTSAGDTFIGFFLKMFIESDDVEKSLLFATKASSVCVTRQGAAVSIPYLYDII